MPAIWGSHVFLPCCSKVSPGISMSCLGHSENMVSSLSLTGLFPLETKPPALRAPLTSSLCVPSPELTEGDTHISREKITSVPYGNICNNVCYRDALCISPHSWTVFLNERIYVLPCFYPHAPDRAFTTHLLPVLTAK